MKFLITQCCQKYLVMKYKFSKSLTKSLIVTSYCGTLQSNSCFSLHQNISFNIIPLTSFLSYNLMTIIRLTSQLRRFNRSDYTESKELGR